MNNSEEKELIKIIKQQPWLIEALEQAKSLNLPDWYIAAGAIRNTVWNYYHKFPTDKNQNDVDVVYFDPKDMKGKKEKEYENKLKSINPKLNWEVVNQARAHLFKTNLKKDIPASKSSCETISHWTETATCTGIRLQKDNSFTICAPYGLSDLMKLIVKPIPKPYQDLPLYKERITKKKWKKIWPRLSIL